MRIRYWLDIFPKHSPTRIPRSSDWINLRNTLIEGWQCRKGGVRLCLIPVRDGKEIVGPMIGMPMLNRGAKRFGKNDWRIQVKAIDRGPASRLFVPLNRRAR